MTNWKKLSASLREVIDEWVQKASADSKATNWINAYFPDDGVDLVTDAAVNVLKAIESSSNFTMSEHND